MNTYMILSEIAFYLIFSVVAIAIIVAEIRDRRKQKAWRKKWWGE